jgi:uncharacterized protein (TIGR01777 family)
MAREIVVTGANGWIGGYVGEALHGRGWAVTGVSRTPDQARGRRPEWTWIGTGPEFEEAVTRAGAVLNLAGRHPFEQRWTPEYVEVMLRSRVDITERIVTALAAAPAAERLLVSGSGYPVYGDRGDDLLTEDEPVERHDVIDVVDALWEDAAAPAAADCRLVILRTGLTLGNDGGAFPVIRQPFDAGAGVVLGSGRQWVPWIHLEDAVRLIVATIEEPVWSGPVNVVAPEPARHAELAEALASALGVPCETTVPAGAVTEMLGGAADLLLKSQRIVPAKAQAAGFSFLHPGISAAVKDLVSA